MESIQNAVFIWRLYCALVNLHTHGIFEVKGDEIYD